HAAKAVLRCAQHAMVQAAGPLEVQHRIDDVLERLWPRDGAALGHMPDEEDGSTALLRVPLQAGSALADLPDVPRRSLDVVGVNCLDRIDEEYRGPMLGGALEDGLEPRLRQEQDVACTLGQPLGAQPGLRSGLLARDVERGVSGGLQTRCDLEQQRALADTGLTANEHERAGDRPATAHEIALGDSSRPASAVHGVDAGPANDGRRGRNANRRRACARAAPLLRRGLLDERVPCVAGGTLPLPARSLVAALGAEEERAHLRHARYAASGRSLYDSKRVHSLRKKRSTVPVGPLRCFEMISSALPTTPFSCASRFAM